MKRRQNRNYPPLWSLDDSEVSRAAELKALQKLLPRELTGVRAEDLGTVNRQYIEASVRVERLSGCWIWIRRCTDLHRPYVNISHTRVVPAAVAAYALFKGDVPTGLNVCHTCDNERCVCPEHLWLGTTKDNYDDMVRKGRAHWQKPKPLAQGLLPL